MNNKNMSSGKGLTLVKTTLLPGQERVTVVASLPTNPSCDVTANIPIGIFANSSPRNVTSIHSLIPGVLDRWLAEPVVIAVALCVF